MCAGLIKASLIAEVYSSASNWARKRQAADFARKLVNKYYEVMPPLLSYFANIGSGQICRVWKVI